MARQILLTCSVPQCGAPHYARGFCKRHRRQWKEGKDPIIFVNRCCCWCDERLAITARPDTVFCSLSCKMKYHRSAPGGAYTPDKILANRGHCSASQCHNQVHANGYCQFHNNRFRRHGDPLYEPECRAPSRCQVERCERSAFALGYCQKHYANLYRHEDPLYAQTTSKEWQRRRSHPLHSRYMAMITRCYNAKAANFPDYGGRGIRVCGRWLQNFWTFVNDIGVPKDPTLQLHRINNDGPYEPGNVEWVTVASNSRTRRSTVLTQSMADAIREERSAGTTITAIAAAHRVSISTAHSVLTGTRWNDGRARDLRVRRLDRSGIDLRLDGKKYLNGIIPLTKSR